MTLREDAVLKGNFNFKTAFRYLKTFAFRYLKRRTCEYCFVPSFTSSGCFQKSNLHFDKLSNENSNVEHYFSATAWFCWKWFLCEYRIKNKDWFLHGFYILWNKSASTSAFCVVEASKWCQILCKFIYCFI